MMLSSCSRLLENDYYSVTPLAETSSEPVSDSGALRASNYNELKSAVIRFVRGGIAEGRVRLRNYTGNVKNDTDRVCREVVRNEPIGAYALEYISSSYTLVIADYDVIFSLTFRRTYEQIQAVKSIGGSKAFENQLIDTLTNFDSGLTFETSLYSENQFDFNEILKRVYYEHPLLAQGMPEVSVSLFPEETTELRRIVELKLTYTDEPELLKERSKQSEVAASIIVNSLSSDDDLTEPQKALALYTALGEICDFDHELYTAVAEGQQAYPSTYDAFINRRVLPESYALAYKLLCDIAEIPCLVVVGQRGAEDHAWSFEHAWNLIYLEGHWYHVDLAADSMGETQEYNYFLLTDSSMQTDYRWKVQSYPSADDGELTYETVAIENEEP